MLAIESLTTEQQAIARTGLGAMPINLSLLSPEQLTSARTTLNIASVAGDITTLTTASTANTAGVAANTASIATLTTATNTNASAIAANTTALDGKIPLTQRATANGVATLDATGKVPLTQLNVSGLQFKGAWNPTTNTPTLIDGTGSTGDFYKASAAGSRNTGNGSFIYAVGDWIIYAGGTWQRLGSSDAVSMVNGKLGAVVLTAADVGALPSSYIAPVASVNGKTGAAVLNAADVGALASTYTPPNQVKAWGDVTGKPDFATLYQKKQRGIIGPAIPAVFASIPTSTSITSSTETKVPFTTIRYDQFSTSDGSGGFTVPSWAKYARGTFHLQWAANATGERQARMSVAGASAQGANMTRAAASSIIMTIMQTTAIIPVTAGQLLSVTAWHNAGTAIQIQTSGSTWFQIEFFEEVT